MKDTHTEKDVATVEALEQLARELRDALKAAQPAIGRLCEAKYPGADWVSAQLDEALDDQTMGCVIQVLGSLEMFRKAAGDPGAFDYLFYVDYLKQDLGDAAKEIIDRNGNHGENLKSVEAMRQYAATAGAL